MRKSISLSCAVLTVLLSLGVARASVITAPPGWKPMKMLALTLNLNNPADPTQGGSIVVGSTAMGSYNGTIFTPTYVTTMDDQGWLNSTTRFQPGVDSFAAPYSVLNGTSFARTFGWSNAAPPAGYLFKVVQTAATPGLKVYNPYDSTFPEIYTSAAGGAITWDGDQQVNGVTQDYADVSSMFHPVYALPAQNAGGVFADYTVYLIKADTGAVISQITPGQAHLQFTSVMPEPGSLLLLAAGAVMALRRRSGRS